VRKGGVGRVEKIGGEMGEFFSRKKRCKLTKSTTGGGGESKMGFTAYKPKPKRGGRGKFLTFATGREGGKKRKKNKMALKEDTWC